MFYLIVVGISYGLSCGFESIGSQLVNRSVSMNRQHSSISSIDF